jgi:hypothetical protein
MVPPSGEETRAMPEDDKTSMPSKAAERAVPAGTKAVLALPIGIRLNEFEITGVISEGGFGIVYAA